MAQIGEPSTVGEAYRAARRCGALLARQQAPSTAGAVGAVPTAASASHTSSPPPPSADDGLAEGDVRGGAGVSRREQRVLIHLMSTQTIELFADALDAVHAQPLADRVVRAGVRRLQLVATPYVDATYRT